MHPYLPALLLCLPSWIDDFVCVCVSVPLCVRLKVALAIEGGGEGGIVQSSRHGARPGVRWHPGDAVLSLVMRKLPPQLVYQDVRLEEKLWKYY